MVKLFALSPNSNNLDIIRYLVKEGVIVSVGHSAASFEQVMAAVEAGLSHATHTFNGMKGFTHRDPGVVGAVLDSDEITAEVILTKFMCIRKRSEFLSRQREWKSRLYHGFDVCNRLALWKI